ELRTQNSWWRFPLLVALLARVYTWLVAAAVLAAQPRTVRWPIPVDLVPLWHPLRGAWEPLVGAFMRYDGQWYVHIAQHGYAFTPAGQPLDHADAFFPLYPAFIAAIAGPLRLDQAGYGLVGLVISSLAATTALVWLY